MTRCFRIVQTSHAGAAFDGKGAESFGGRWNSVGVKMVYTSATLSLAILEILVHLESDAVLESRYRHIAADIPEGITIERLSLRKRHPLWAANPPGEHSRRIGDAWGGSCRSAALLIPSAIVPSEMNILLNPLHRDFSRIIIHKPQKIVLDARLLAKLERT